MELGLHNYLIYDVATLYQPQMIEMVKIINNRQDEFETGLILDRVTDIISDAYVHTTLIE